MFRVLKPIYTPRGDWFTVSWICMGTAKDYSDAKSLYGGYPVLERVKQ